MILWQKTMERLVGVIRAASARSPRANLHLIEQVLSEINVTVVPEDFVIQPCTLETLLPRAAVYVKEYLKSVSPQSVRELLTRRVEQLGKLKISSPDNLKLEDPPDRDVREYLEKHLENREWAATNHVAALIEVAQIIAKNMGETIEPETIRNNDRVKELTHGSWANAYSVVPTVQMLLEKEIPKSNRKMSK